MDLFQWVTFVVDGLVKGSELLLEYLKVIAWPGVVFALAMVYRRPLSSILHRLKNATVGGTSIDLEAALLAEDSAKALEAAQAAPQEVGASTVEPQSRHESGDAIAPRDAAEGPVDSTHRGKEHAESAAGDSAGSSELDSWSWRPSNVSPTRRSAFTKLRHYGSWDLHSPEVRNIPMMLLAWRDLEAEAEKIGKLLEMTPNNSKNLAILGFELKRLGYMDEETEDLMLRLADLRGRLERNVDDVEITDSTGAAFVASVANITDILSAARQSLEANKWPRAGWDGSSS